MIDREKVKYDIERCICHVPDACRDCSHYKHGEYLDCMEELLKDALELLKEQDKRINMKQRRIDQLCKQLTDLKHRFHEKTELVRCKDCKHAPIHCIESVLGEPLYDCHNPNWNYDDTPTMLWNWFCADGERQEGR